MSDTAALEQKTNEQMNERSKDEFVSSDQRFQVRDRLGPSGVTLSSHATREEADKALNARIAEAIPGEAPIVADMGVQPGNTSRREAVEAGKTAEQKAAEKNAHNPGVPDQVDPQTQAPLNPQYQNPQDQHAQPQGIKSYEDARR